MSLQKPVSIFKSLLSTPFQICIVMNFILLLIVVSSFFHHPQVENSGDEDGGADSYVHEDFDGFHGTLSPFLSPPPAAPPPTMKNDLEKARKTAVAANASTEKITAKEGDSTRDKVSTGSESTLRKKQDIVEVTYGDKTASEVHQKPVFSDFSRLTSAKDIKKEQTTVDGVKIRTTEKFKRATNFTKVTECYPFQKAAFDYLPKLAEAEEIKKAHLHESEKQGKTFQNPQKTTTKPGQINGKQTQNQAKKQPENEDHGGQDDTMEATWRAINGETKPKEKQLKKTETWHQRRRFVLPDDDDEYSNQIKINMEEKFPVPSSSSSVCSSPVKDLKKSMTFNDTVTLQRRGGLIRKDPSMNLEEFNQKVDAFIKKFNHDLRLQRQESDQRYLDMIKRGL